MKKTLTLLTALIILAAFSKISYGEEKKNNITLAEAKAIALKVIPGEIVKAEREKGHYEIKIRTSEGKIEKVYIDAKDGNIMKRDRKSYDRDRDEYRDRDNDHRSEGDEDRGKDRNRDRDRDSNSD